MKKPFKVIIIILTVMALTAASGFLISKARVNTVAKTLYPVEKEFSSLAISPVIIEPVFDLSDKKKMAEFHSHVFVAKVEEVKGTRYFDPRYDDLLRLKAEPKTLLSVTVLENCKGKLPTDKAIDLLIDGGISLDGKSLVATEGTVMPVAGRTYIFCASEDSELGLYSSFGSDKIPLDGYPDNRSGLESYLESAGL